MARPTFLRKLLPIVGCSSFIAACGGSPTIPSTASPTLANSTLTFASFASEPGAIIANGQQLEYTLDNARFTVFPSSTRIQPGTTNTLVSSPEKIEITIRPSGTTLSWMVYVYAPAGEDLVVKTYEGAQYPGNQGHPSVVFFGGGFGCESVGTFRVTQLEYGPRPSTGNGIAIRRFRVLFDQQCRGRDGNLLPPHMRGELQIGSDFIPS